MEINIPNNICEIIKKFEDNSFEIYIVGGAVRDILQGRILYDWDFTTSAKPDEILKMFPDAYYDNQFGTVGISNDDERPFEITTFRTEHGYSDSRRPDEIKWGNSLEDDLQRRDFTINAMALQRDTAENSAKRKAQSRKNKARTVLCDMRLIDLYNGQKDLQDKLIRAVGDPQDRIQEDALRMMRAVRIASELGFNIEENTKNAIKSNASSIHKIAKERVRDELLKILSSPHPCEGIILLRECNLMQEILPEFEKTFGVEQASPGRHHIYDVGTHSLMSLKNCPSSDPIVRFATLIHDIGKPQTFKKLESGTITFYNHEVISTKIAERIAERLKFSNKQKDKLVNLVRWHQFTVNENQTDSAIRRFIRNVGIDYIYDMLDLRTGDRLGGGASKTSWRLEEFKARLIEVQKQPFSVKDLKIDGNDVMKILKIKSGPKVGETLNKLFALVEKQEIPNSRSELLKNIKTDKTIESL